MLIILVVMSVCIGLVAAFGYEAERLSFRDIFLSASITEFLCAY